MRGMTPERIYLLARMGSTRAALELIMRELVDVEQAVQFCKEQDDPELWEDLIRCSLDKPPFIIVLLRNVRGASRGLLVSSEASCPECGEAIVRDPVGAEDLAVLACHHTFHASCLGQSVVCTVCNKGGDAGFLSGHTSTYYYKET